MTKEMRGTARRHRALRCNQFPSVPLSIVRGRGPVSGRSVEIRPIRQIRIPIYGARLTKWGAARPEPYRRDPMPIGNSERAPPFRTFTG